MVVVDTLQQNTLGNPRKAGVAAEDTVDNLEAAVVGSLRKVEQKGIQMGVGVDKERHTQEEGKGLEVLFGNSCCCC